MTRKKVKPSTPAPKGKDSSNHKEQGATGLGRGDARGSRGGRGGRGGGRGGAVRGLSRGGHRETNGRHVSSPAPAGETSSSAWAKDPASATAHAATDAVNGDVPDDAAKGTTDIATQPSQVLEPSSTQSTSVGAPAQADASASTNGSAVSTATPPIHKTSILAPPPPVVKPAKTPGTSKLSWAQIAKCVFPHFSRFLLCLVTSSETLRTHS